MPLFSALATYDRAGYVSFHMPGHKHGSGAPPGAVAALGRSVFSLDKTAVIGGYLDALHAPAGVLREAQDMLASCFGAARSYFLFNGTAAGAQVLLLALCRPGDRVVVSADLDAQTALALILAGVEPTFCPPARLDGLPAPVSASALLECLRDLPRCRLALLRGPSAAGQCADLAAWAAATRRSGTLLAVDERFGAHFRFHPALPEDALSAGADAALHGHCCLPFPRQTGALHFGPAVVDGPGAIRQLDRAYQLCTVTSVSYVMLAAMDASRAMLADRGRAMWEEAVGRADRLCRALRRAGWRVVGGPGEPGWDPCRALAWCGRGSAAARARLRRAGLLVEQLGDWLSLAVTPGTPDAACDLAAALLAGGAGESPAGPPAERAEQASLDRECVLRREQALSPRRALYGRLRRLPLADCAGEVCGELVSWPAGAPGVLDDAVLLLPGQVVGGHHIRLLAKSPRWRRDGLAVVEAPAGGERAPAGGERAPAGAEGAAGRVGR